MWVVVCGWLWAVVAPVKMLVVPVKVSVVPARFRIEKGHEKKDTPAELRACLFSVWILLGD